MRGRKVVLLLVPVLIMSMLLVVPAAMAHGPEQAAEVGNNPNLPGNSPVLDTPSGVHNVWSSTGYFNHWITASKDGGKMNNAVIVGLGPNADPNLGDLLTNKAEYENTWIYFSQTVFRAFLKVSGASDAEAAAEASKYPDGIYWHFTYVG